MLTALLKNMQNPSSAFACRRKRNKLPVSFQRPTCRRLCSTALARREILIKRLEIAIPK